MRELRESSKLMKENERELAELVEEEVKHLLDLSNQGNKRRGT
jgi:hypothetical protein